MQAQLRLNKGPQARAFHSYQATEILYGGAAGGGKSHLLRILALVWCYLVPGIQVYLFRREYPQLFRNHLEGPTSLLVMANPYIQGGWAKWNWSRKELEFWNGSLLHLCHAQNEMDVHDYQGPELHALLVDELTMFTAYQYRFLRSRVRAPGLAVPSHVPWTFPRIFNGSNPGGIGHNWVKGTWVDRAPPMKVWRAPRDEGGMVRQYVPAKLRDNLAMTRQEQLEYAYRLEGLNDPHLVKAMLYGLWNIVAGGMFDDVWDLGFNTCPPFDVPKGWPIHRSFDWGSSAPFSVGWWTTSNGETVTFPNGEKKTWVKGHRILMAEWYGWNHRPENPQGCRLDEVAIAKGILEREEQHGWKGRVQPGAADSQIYETSRGRSIGDTMADHGVDFVPADKGPGSRVNGWALMRRMMKAAWQVPQEFPGITVVDTCQDGFIRTVPALVRHQLKREDIADKQEDHSADQSRYELSRQDDGLAHVPLIGA